MCVCLSVVQGPLRASACFDDFRATQAVLCQGLQKDVLFELTASGFSSGNAVGRIRTVLHSGWSDAREPHDSKHKNPQKPHIRSQTVANSEVLHCLSTSIRLHSFWLLVNPELLLSVDMFFKRRHHEIHIYALSPWATSKPRFSDGPCAL